MGEGNVVGYLLIEVATKNGNGEMGEGGGRNSYTNNIKQGMDYHGASEAENRSDCQIVDRHGSCI